MTAEARPNLVPPDVARNTGMPTPMVGMLLFIASEVMFFGGLFAAYFNSRATHAAEWGPPGGHELEAWPLATILTILLVTSSVTMQFGVAAIRRGDQRRLRMWVGLTLVLGVLFLLGQLYDYSTLGFGIGDGIFATTFYTLTGFHGAHVFGGAVGMTILFARAMQGQFSARNHVAVEAISMYWHFVDVVWIALFFTLYFLR
ncbi:MAG TPA: cytochrome c oxidase subunit 3 [Candidatus Limnocylindria bacterium]|nr:cytochrome c oxidase subunit 3 [Candidatus Limnocylindria bacterium]